MMFPLVLDLAVVGPRPQAGSVAATRPAGPRRPGRATVHRDPPDRLWLTDMHPQAGGAPSEHPTAEGKVYLCAVKDVWSNRIVGYSIADRMTAKLAVDALDNACQLRRPTGMTVVRSNRGSQGGFNWSLQHPEMIEVFDGPRRCVHRQRRHGVAFSVVRNNVLNRRCWATRDDLRLALVVWIEKTYHRWRRQQALGRPTPVECKTLFQAAPAA